MNTFTSRDFRRHDNGSPMHTVASNQHTHRFTLAQLQNLPPWWPSRRGRRRRWRRRRPLGWPLCWDELDSSRFRGGHKLFTTSGWSRVKLPRLGCPELERPARRPPRAAEAENRFWAVVRAAAARRNNTGLAAGWGRLWWGANVKGKQEIIASNLAVNIDWLFDLSGPNCHDGKLCIFAYFICGLFGLSTPRPTSRIQAAASRMIGTFRPQARLITDKRANPTATLLEILPHLTQNQN